MPDMTDAAARLALHPRRKRKFFADLAHLLDEDPPEVRPLHGAFFGPELAEDAVLRPPASETQTQTLFVPSHSPLTGDSFDSVEFGAPRTRSSGVSSFGTSQQSESMADSLLFLPHGSLNTSNTQKHRDQHVRFEFDLETRRDSKTGTSESLPVTTLVNTGMISEKPPATGRLELADYYDADRMCELSPCWLRSDRASCELHRGPIRRPMLLFCLQALDEFIARNEWQGQQRWRVQACKVARRALTSMWEADVLGVVSLEGDIVVADCAAKKTTIVGVALDAWRIIARYWEKYKQNYLHQEELYFTDAPESVSTQLTSKWDQVRGLLHIFGMKPSMALRLAEQIGGDSLDACNLTDKQFHAVAHSLPSTAQLRVGMEYLGCKSTAGADLVSVARRPMISQQDGKTAFNAILIHLKKWNEEVQVFPCGSFSRGAAFISVLDVLVAVPAPDNDLPPPAEESDDESYQSLVAALVAAKVIQKGAIRQLSRNRGACIIPFKNSSILLDLKVYRPPQSWLALLYFTGPEDFVVKFFTDLLKRSLREITDTSFECIYAAVAEVIGTETILAIASEKDLFDLVDREYLQPTDRV
ncbi:hypothetical protein PR003_g6856 [Phytophthora rubi]|uniref:DNA polymerase n=1 Tax=Phytophthora rubi TaxID=129364 RepID=A0A6A4FND1_9STRA|nr:hypothetical protein PR002_g6597 [Phytophthora rubi]KAE9041526.1 hypothetical protein PR001_g6576 [Phytophthora rubi]KAE9347590.1 hypothetical protein PR003_g6856 [Phytophthora rubi]